MTEKKKSIPIAETELKLEAETVKDLEPVDNAQVRGGARSKSLGYVGENSV